MDHCAPKFIYFYELWSVCLIAT